MMLKENYAQMVNEELMRELDRLADELEDLEKERGYLLRRTNAHVSESVVKGKESAIDNIRGVAREIEGILLRRGFGAKFLE